MLKLWGARIPPLAVARASGRAEYESRRQAMADELARRAAHEASLAATSPEPFHVEALCYPCRRSTRMRVEREKGRKGHINWREWLVCGRCGLVNRSRAALQLFEQECRPGKKDRIYLTEAVTPMYRELRARYPALVGSEFLQGRVPRGAVDERGIRNEDLTALTFADASLDFVLSFDVLEHIADYRRALAEARRVLRPGGTFLFSAPFILGAAATQVRAKVNADGSITHLREPHYHGDPLSPEGVLCFQYFGWDLLDDLRQAGFARAEALLYWSDKLGYLGTEQVMFIAN